MQLQLKVVKQSLNKGFSLIEVSIVLFIILVMSSILTPIKIRLISSNDFISSAIHLQYLALLNKTDYELDTPIMSEYPIRYNANGNINMGQTIMINSRKFVILLGTGRIHEKRVYGD